MPSNVIDAKSADKKKPLEVQDVEKEFFISVFFDGTNNKMNTKQETAKPQNKDAQAFGGSVAKLPSVDTNRNGNTPLRQKDTNVAALSCLVDNKKVREGGKVKYYNHFYIEGPGTTYDGDKKDKGWFQKLKDKPSEVVGMAVGTWGQGVIAKVARGVSEVHRYLYGNTQQRERPKVVVHFCVYGFSRGAACARLFAYLVARAADNNATIALESVFKDYLYDGAKKLYTSRLTFLDDFNKANRIVEFLGIYDTVSSIGIIDETGISNVKAVEDNVTIFHNLNARDYGLYSPQLGNVHRTFHICAMDEFRKNFAITDVGKKVPASCIEVFVPGCHSDVGGSYEDAQDSTVCLKYINGFKWTKLVMKDPRNPEKGTGNVNKENLLALGWAVEKSWYKEAWDGISSYDDNFLMNTFQATVSYTRTVKRGLSNITFVMMWDRTHKDVSKVWGCDVFNDYFPLDDFQIPMALSSTAKLMNANNLPTGKRSWIIPGNSLDSEAYKTLRSNYIHFSATDRLGISIVNAPNWKDNILCRIVYHGDRNDSSIHYMQDYD